MSDPDELIDAGIELIEQLIEDGNVIGAAQLTEQVASWIADVESGNDIQLGDS